MDPNVLKSVMDVWRKPDKGGYNGVVVLLATDSSEDLMERVSPPKRIPVRSSSSLALAHAFAEPGTSGSKTRPHLLNLPPEIIQQIAKLLRRPNAACFTFTCKRIRKILGTQYWESFRRDLSKQEVSIQHYLKSPLSEPLHVSALSAIEGSDQFERLCLQRQNIRPSDYCLHPQCHCAQEGTKVQKAELLARRQLLALLSRDVPDMVRCGRCIMLHKPNRSVGPVGMRECQASDTRMGVERVIYEGFGFTHLQLAMKYHRMGHPDTRAYLKSLSRSTTTSSSDLTHPQITQTNHKFRIVANCIYLRTQHWIVFPIPQTKTPNFTSQTQLQSLLPSKQQICAHLSFGDPDRNRLASSLVEKRVLFSKGKKYLDDVLRCRVLHKNPKGECGEGNGKAYEEVCGCMAVHRCRYCETEFQIDVKEMSQGVGPGKSINKGMAVVVTKWCNMGAGEMWRDDRWMQHFEPDRVYEDSNGLENRASNETLFGSIGGRIMEDRKEGKNVRPVWVPGAIRDAFEGGRLFEFWRCLRGAMEKELMQKMEKVRVRALRKIEREREKEMERNLFGDVDRWRVEREGCVKMLGMAEVRGWKRLRVRE